MKTRASTKITKIDRATDLMRTGSALVQMHNTRNTGWYLVPGGEVAAKVAIALLERPDVQPNHDELFPGISQTFRFAASAAKGARRASPQHWPRKENIMADEFPEIDLDTPSEDDLDAAYGSQHLGVVDVGDKKIRTKISRVRMEEVKDTKTGKVKKKPVVFFENIDKGLILNVTNRDTLNSAFGKKPAGWLNASVGIFVDPNVVFGGQKTGGVRLRALLPPAPAKPAPKPAPEPSQSPPAQGLNDEIPW